jgi:hypothetical protein
MKQQSHKSKHLINYLIKQVYKLHGREVYKFKNTSEQTVIQVKWIDMSDKEWSGSQSSVDMSDKEWSGSQSSFDMSGKEWSGNQSSFDTSG